MTKVYLCNIDKNTECRKTGCVKNGGPCRATKNAQFAWKDIHGDPIPAYDEDLAASVFYDSEERIDKNDD